MSINHSFLEDLKKSLANYKKAKLLIVTKNQTYADISDLLKSGYRLFGENRVQEASLKYTKSVFEEYKDIKLDLIGPLQTNKTKQALLLFDSIQSLDRKKLIDEIYKLKNKMEYTKTKNFYLQVNIGMEKQKAGVSPKELNSLYQYAMNLNINIVGLMCIPPFDQSPEIFFKEMNAIRNNIDKNLILSMGMSSDYSFALENGSDLIRIGSKIFN